MRVLCDRILNIYENIRFYITFKKTNKNRAKEAK